MSARRRLLVLGLLAALPLALASGACHKKKPPPGKGAPGSERLHYTPVPPPPTRTLKPGEPTQPPRLPG